MKKRLNQNLRTILIILVPLLLVSIFSTYVVASAEKYTNPLWADTGSVLWWWLITISTIGYGDMVPTTHVGRFFGALVVLSGIVFFGTVISEVGLLLKIATQRDHLGLKHITYKDHIIILGDNPLSSSLIGHIKRISEHKKVVVVTHKLENKPFEDVAFVKGDPRYHEILEMANVKEASLVIILADDQVNNPDAYSIIIGSEVEAMNPHVTKIAEITDERWRDIFKDSGIDVFVTERKFLKSVHHYNQIDTILRKVII